MEMKYKNVAQTIQTRLQRAHNESKSKIRHLFFEAENDFFRKNIRDKNVLVAGSGLGHDAFELAKYNKNVVGVEILENLLDLSQKALSKTQLDNVEFIFGDLKSLKYQDNNFDVSVLNMGTISDFENKQQVLEELLRVSNKVYFDFYPPNTDSLETRKRMYEEEGWQDVKIENKTIVSSDGLSSESVSEKNVREIAEDLGVDIELYPICDFATMAVLSKQ